MQTIKNKLISKGFIVITIISLLGLLTLSSCSDDSGTEPETSSATIHGRVTDNSGYGSGLNKVNGSVEGAVVTVAEFESDGSLRTVSNSSVETNAQGEFTIESNTTDEENLVVVATKGPSEWKAVISSRVESNSENYSPPLNDETTAEAEVYAEFKSSNETGSVSYSDVAYYVDSEIAAKIKSNASLAAEVKNAIVAEAEAESEIMSNAYFGYSNTEIESKNEAEANAQVNFESELYLGNDTESSYNASWSSYFNILINAYSSSTNISMTDYAKAKEASGKAMIKFASNLDSETKLKLQKRDAYLLAHLIAEATVMEYNRAGASETEQQEAENEVENLIASVRIAGSVAAINEAFAQYRNSMKAHMKSSFEAQADAFISIETVIENTTKVTLETALSVATTTSAVVNAYNAFYTGVDSTVSSNIAINDNMKLEAYSNLYVLIYMHD